MRYSLLQLFAILSLGLFSACSSDLDSRISPEIPLDSRAIELSYKLPSQEITQSRATETGTASENNIQEFQAFIFDQNGILIRQFRVGDGLQTLDRSKLRLLIAEAEVSKYQNKELQLVLIANYSENLEVNTLADLKSTSLYANFNKVNPESFVMTGFLNIDRIRWSEGNPVFEVLEELKLDRVAAKVQFEISDIDVYDEANNTKVHYELVGSPEVRFINYQTHSSLLPLHQNTGFELSSTEYVQMKDEGSSYILSSDYYSYESDWSTKNGFNANDEAHLMLKLVFRAKNSSGVYGEQKEYFYHIPINYRFPTAEMDNDQIASLYKIKRNHLYRIVSSIHQLGSEDEGEPFNLDSEISVAPWVNHDIDGNIDTAHFLMVKEKNPMMPNINRIQLDYQSSMPITITDIRVEYTSYDRNGVASKVSDSNPRNLRIGVNEELKYIDIINPIPVNFVPLNIFFTVRHKSGSNLSQDVHVVQYPPKYVTATKSTGYVNSTPTSPYADFRFHDVLGAMSLFPGDSRNSPQINDVFYQITTLVNTDNEYIGDPCDSDGYTKRDENSNRYISPQFIIGTQHGMSIGISQYNKKKDMYWQRFSYGDGYGSVRNFNSYSIYSSRKKDNKSCFIAYRSANERCKTTLKASMERMDCTKSIIWILKEIKNQEG